MNIYALGQKFSTLKDSGKALRAAGYIPNFGIGGSSMGGSTISVSGAGSKAGPSGDGVKELEKRLKMQQLKLNSSQIK